MTTKAAIVYPESDGKPMADNTLQALWIFVIHGNLTALYRTRDDVFVAADNFWYPVEGELFRMAPDVYVVFGRPKGHRGSYQQWLEGNVPLTVVFEVLSPSNDDDEMQAKFQFYEEHGVQEYYVFDPFSHLLEAYTRGPHGRPWFEGASLAPLPARCSASGSTLQVTRCGCTTPMASGSSHLMN